MFTFFLAHLHVIIVCIFSQLIKIEINFRQQGQLINSIMPKSSSSKSKKKHSTSEHESPERKHRSHSSSPSNGKRSKSKSSTSSTRGRSGSPISARHSGKASSSKKSSTSRSLSRGSRSPSSARSRHSSKSRSEKGRSNSSMKPNDKRPSSSTHRGSASHIVVKTESKKSTERSPSKRTSAQSPEKMSPSSKRSKPKSIKKNRHELLSPASTVSTASASLSSPGTSPASAKSSKSNRSRDRKASKSMKSLSMQSNVTLLKEPRGPPEIVSKAQEVNEEDINILTGNFVDEYHLMIMLDKKKKLDENEKSELAAMNLKDTIWEVVHAHTPSEMKMVYVQVCGSLSLRASMDFFKSPVKGKEGLVDIIWDNRKQLNKFYNE